MIEIYTGLPGTGKSIAGAYKLHQLVKRNLKAREKLGLDRKILTNLKLSDEFVAAADGLIDYWSDPQEIMYRKGVDVYWDEIATHFDSTQWQNTPLEVKRMLQQHRKRGIDIYGNTQEFAMIDISFRRLTSSLYYCQKFIGSRSPHPTKPPLRMPWGLVIVKEVDRSSYDKSPNEYVFTGGFLQPLFGWEYILIRKKWYSIYDTLHEIERGTYPPLQHIEQICELHGAGCDHKKTIHR